MARIGFIGTGNMASALIHSIINKGITDGGGITASDVNIETLEKINKQLGINTTTSNSEVVKNSDIIFLSVKPKHMEEVLTEIKSLVSNNKILISIAAGIKISAIEKIVGKKKIVRVMPNTPCLVSEMAAGYSPNENLEEAEIDTIEIILNSSGKSIRLNELLLDAVTGLSGSGPAFVARLIEYFIQAGVQNGLRKDISKKLTIQTFLGTAKLLQDKDMDPEKLIGMVSSPGGTTASGRKVLEESDVEKVIDKTVSAAVKKSHELGEK